MRTLQDQYLLELHLINGDNSVIVKSDQKVEEIVKALNNKRRRKIMSFIQKKPADISEIASRFNETTAGISAQIKKLEKAGLITCYYVSGKHGVRKVSRLRYDKLIIKI